MSQPSCFCMTLLPVFPYLLSSHYLWSSIDSPVFLSFLKLPKFLVNSLLVGRGNGRLGGWLYASWMYHPYTQASIHSAYWLSERMWSIGEGNGKPLQYSCLENPMNSRKRQNDRIPKEELPRSLGAQYATGDQQRNNSRKNEGMEPKHKQYPAVDVTGDRSKVRCCTEPILHRNLECQVHESRQTGSGQTRDGKGEHQHSRNQQTKIDWNGWI